MTVTRNSLRRAVRPFRESSDLKAVLICLFDIGLFCFALAAVVLASGLVLKLLAGLLMGLAIARLFVIGHDACHQAFFSNRTANRWIGRLVFLPSLTPYSLWEAGHNVSHHVYTNLKGHDFVWAPMSKTEYDAATPARRRLERIYRSGFGFWAYYGIEIWWRKMLFPSLDEVPVRRPAHFYDGLLVTVVGVIWVAALTMIGLSSGQSVPVLLLCGFLLPFFIWNLLMGAVIFFHHTNPDIVWYDDVDAWEASRNSASGTVRLTFPGRLGRLVNNIMEHPAHHLDVRIPLYQLEQAQQVLAELPSGALTQPLTWGFLRNCIHSCKLYDYTTQTWLDFDGVSTSTCLKDATPALN